MDSDLLEEKDFARYFCAERPLLDVRSGVEFAKGSLPRAVNVPILNTVERHKVGLCYKHSGQEAAIALGHKLVSGSIRDERVQAWSDFARRNPDGALFCWRGGLRSQIAQQWLGEAGIHYPRVAGGFKVLRQFLLFQMERLISESRFVIVGGRTGSGKTEFLRQFWQGVDLEALAHHRGSAFGGDVTEQPRMVNFENALAMSFLKLKQKNPPYILLEDEGANIGNIFLPPILFKKMSISPVVVIEGSLESRVSHILKTYTFNQPDFFYDAALRISKRLGGDHTRVVLESMRQAFRRQEGTGDVSGHCEWIAVLLKFYYDPLYDYQMERKAPHVVFKGTPAEVAGYLAHNFLLSPQPREGLHYYNENHRS